MKLTQSWVGYLDRSYQQIKQSVIARLVINNPEITDHNESNILIIIISIFSGIAEMLSYYIDMMGREGFLGTALRFTSVIRLAQLIDYNARAMIPALANLLFSLVDQNGNPYYTISNVTIPPGTTVNDNNGNSFITTEEVQIVPGQAGAFSTAINYEIQSSINIGITDGTPLQKILLPSNIVDGSLSAIINNEPWILYDSMGLMTANTKGFIVAVLDDGNAYMIFGDGNNGIIPLTGSIIIGTYQSCDGSDGNDPPNTINQLQDTFTLPDGISMQVTNPDYASGGADFESIDDVRNHAPRSLRTLNRAVTYQDYKDVAILCPGVGDAEVSYCCGKYVTVYIIPSTQGTATQALISKVSDWFSTRRMITTLVQPVPAGISKLFLIATIFAKPLYTENQVLIEVLNLLAGVYAFGSPSATINGKPSISAIIGLIESALSVDHVDIDSVQILPNVQPINGNISPLPITFSSLPKTGQQYTYTIVYKLSSNLFFVFQGATPKGSVGLNQTFNDGIVAFMISSANYVDGLSWQFIAVPSYPEIFPSSIINITDFSVPILDIGPLVNANNPRTFYGELTVITQGVASNSLPPCS